MEKHEVAIRLASMMSGVAALTFLALVEAYELLF